MFAIPITLGVSDMDDFEIIEESQVVSFRSRKPKYSTKVWEYDTPKGQARYMLAVARLHERRGSDYAEELRHKVDARFEYEIELESVLPIYVEDENSSFNNKRVVRDYELCESLNSIVNIPISSGFRVLSAFWYDHNLNTVFCNVPNGVVYKKMSLTNVFDKIYDFISTNAFTKLTSSRKELIWSWIDSANNFKNQIEEVDYEEIY
jgi:hypothetical protein